MVPLFVSQALEEVTTPKGEPLLGVVIFFYPQVADTVEPL